MGRGRMNHPAQALYPGTASPLTVTNRLLSPRRTWSVRVALRSSCASSLLNCSADLTSVVWPLLVTAVITSPERTSARRLLRTSSTITPPLNFRSRFCSAVRSTTANPRRLAACSGGFPRRSLRLVTREITVTVGDLPGHALAPHLDARFAAGL